jgi:hypothetical protein
MPIKQCIVDGKKGWKYGDMGTCYTGPNGKQDAIRQAIAIISDKPKEVEKLAESYSDYPKEASENAKVALRWAEKNGWGSCGTPVGKARANQLAKGEAISRETISRMAGFERHRQNSKKELGDGCGRLMWLAWGGDAGVEWAQRKLKQIDREKKEMSFRELVKLSFDFDGTLTQERVRMRAKRLIEQGNILYIISARSDKEGMLSIADDLGVPHDRVFATGSNQDKLSKILDLEINTHYDNNRDVISKLKNTKTNGIHII